MLLRRFTQHVKDQNWFAVGLDFIIVVIGVFIGIQLGNWNDARADAARERGYLQRLQSDLGVDRARIGEHLEFNRSIRAYGLEALDYAESGAEGADGWTVVLAFFQASQAGGLVTIATTYNELTSTGDVRLIDNLGLRRDLADYYSEPDVSRVIAEMPAYRESVRGIIPIDIQNYIWDNCHETTLTGQRTLPCDRPAGEALDETIDSLVADPALMRQLRYWVSSRRAAENIIANRMSQATELSDRIDTILKAGE
ncbi:MAG: hypothetical protein RLN72_04425 [Henriciella sp.]